MPIKSIISTYLTKSKLTWILW